MRILVCPQEFKGSLTAVQAAAALALGARRAAPGASVETVPFADGGPGTAAIIATAAGGSTVYAEARGPLGTAVAAAYTLFTDANGVRCAAIDAAAACGLLLLPAEARRPLRATTDGVGALIRDAAARGASVVILGVGGTGTNDGGMGAARALGAVLLDANGEAIRGGPLHLRRLAHVTRGTRDEENEAPPLPRVCIAVDVRNRLLGAAGATAIYGAQKGVADWQAPALNAALAQWADRIHLDIGIDVAAIDGAGAGGGLPAGILAATPNAGIESGAALVAEAIDLPRRIAQADLVITGEGSLDAQTGYGKAVGHVIALARAAGVPCLAVAGRIESRPEGLDDLEPLTADGVPPERAVAEAAHLASQATERLLLRRSRRGNG